MDWPVSRVVGSVAPEISNPAPARLIELIVSVDVPDEDRVSVLVAFVSRGTKPKARVLWLTAN